MDDRRVGRVVREVRIRRGWRQRDLAAAASVSQALISRIELGRLDQVSLERLRVVGATLDIGISIDVWWRTGDLDRLVDRGHAALVEHVGGELHLQGWLTRVEVTFNHFGERGPERTSATRRWTRRPTVPVPIDRRGSGGIWFLPYQRLGSAARRVRQVQRVRLSPSRSAA